ncbi:RNA polymerase factor sigma-54 [Carnobacterium alterfunditum]|uniref:RNA polymerase factor sigma-54 n=1 Tax=Carnobacterium alterfunditum TaxID=28230 RepID=UPI0035946BFF
MNFEQNYTQLQKQQLTMTPQLQQAIQMLQYNRKDLVDFLKQKSLENPLISISVKSTPKTQGTLPQKYNSNQSRTDKSTNGSIWDTLAVISTTSLYSAVIDQIHLSFRETTLRDLIIWLAQYLDNNGYLTLSLEDAITRTQADPLQLLDALTLLQQLEPAGVGARNLQECLMLQTERNDEAPDLAYLILEEEFEAFANRKWEHIAKRYAISLHDVQEVSDFIKTLTPHPGALFSNAPTQYIRPDLSVKITDDQKIIVSSVKSGLPVIVFQKDYYEELSVIKDKEVAMFIKEKQSEYEWLKNTLIQREDTILKIGIAIVHAQKAFFLSEDHPIQSLILKTIAEELDIHESTVSRAINGKYITTEFGLFELKHFFTNALVTNSIEGNGSISSNQIKKKIELFIQEEDSKKPLSDQKLVDLLKKAGIEISRRTVTKYREALFIASSPKRKRFD